MKLTPIEWLLNKNEINEDIIKEAKTMEKEQLLEFCKYVIEQEYYAQTYANCKGLKNQSEYYYDEFFYP